MFSSRLRATSSRSRAFLSSIASRSARSRSLADKLSRRRASSSACRKRAPSTVRSRESDARRAPAAGMAQLSEAPPTFCDCARLAAASASSWLPICVAAQLACAASPPACCVLLPAALADAAGDAAGEDVDNEAESEGQRPRPPPPMPSRVLEATRVVPPSEGVAEIARRATCGEVPLLPLCAVPSVQLLRLAILELEARLRLAGVAWTAAPAPVRAAWLEGITAAAHPVELAACLRVLDAHLHSSARSRAFGPERAGRWRVSILSAVTVGAVSEHLIVFNDACAWEMLERSANAASNAHSKGGGGRKSKGGASDAGTGAIIRPRMGVFEFAAASGEAMPAWLEFCEVRPRPSSWREPEPFPCSLRLDPYPQSLPETRHARSRTRCAPPLEESS